MSADLSMVLILKVGEGLEPLLLPSDSKLQLISEWDAATAVQRASIFFNESFMMVGRENRCF